MKTLYVATSLSPKPSEQPRFLRPCPQTTPACSSAWVSTCGKKIGWQMLWDIFCCYNKAFDTHLFYKELREWCWYQPCLLHGRWSYMKSQSQCANLNSYSHNPTNIIVVSLPSRSGLGLVISQSSYSNQPLNLRVEVLINES